MAVLGLDRAKEPAKVGGASGVPWLAAVPFRLTHLPALDGIRGIAVSLVLLCHAYPIRLMGGNVGVDLFFVLSGFLITSILLQEYRRTGSISIGHFYLRRALRLFPAIVLVVVVCVVYALRTETGQRLALTLADAQSVLLYYYNWRMVLVQPWPRFGEHQVMFSHMWSLSVEEQFYIVWPFMLTGLLWLRARSAMVFALLAFGILAPAIARYWLWESWESAYLYFRTDLRADALVWGVLLAWIINAGFVPRGRWLTLLLSCGAFAALGGLVWMSAHDLVSNGFMFRGGFSLVGFLSALLIGVAVWGAPTPLRSFLEWRPLCWIGKVSYGLYLWHYPCFWIAKTLGWGPWYEMIIGMIATFLVSTVSFYCWERPFLRMKDRFGHRREPVQSVRAG